MSGDDEILEWDESEIPNAGDAESQKQASIRAKRSKDKAGDFWKRVFADPIGRQEMWALLTAAHAFEERFACGPNGFPQTEATWFHAGEQSLGLRLYRSWAKIDREGVFKMHDEHDPRYSRPVPQRSIKQEL